MSKETRNPNFLFRMVMIFIVGVLVIINIVLIYSANNLMKDIETLNDELMAERLEVEKLRNRLDRDMSDEDALLDEAKELGYNNPDDIRFEADIPNT